MRWSGLLLPALAGAFTVAPLRIRPAAPPRAQPTAMKGAAALDLTGKVAFVAGVADSTGYGWAICKALANAGATITVGTWPPVLSIFDRGLRMGKFDDDATLEDGSKMKIEKIYPLDAVFDTPEDVPEDVKTNKRYAGLDGFTIQECADKIASDYGKIDILVHSLANGPEVAKPLLETSRRGYLAAMSASSYSLVSCVQRFGPIMNEGGSVLSLGFIAANKVVPSYGGGMSSAKAQLESDTRTLAWEVSAAPEPPLAPASADDGRLGVCGRTLTHRARVAGGAGAQDPRQLHLGWPAQVARGLCHPEERPAHLHRSGHRLLQSERAAAEGFVLGRDWRRRRVPSLARLRRGHRRRPLRR